MKLNIEQYKEYALLGIFGPIIAITEFIGIILMSPFAILGYIIAKIFKIEK